MRSQTVWDLAQETGVRLVFIYDDLVVPIDRDGYL